MKKFYGTGVALVTPFDENFHIDFKALRKVLSHTAKGCDYYVVMGTTGESATLSREEKQQVLEFVVANNKKQLPIVYGIGGNDTSHVLDEIKSTDLSGVDALLSVSPYYNKPSQEGIYQHFKAIAKASPLPVILYNVPGRTSSNLTADTTLRLAEVKNIIGIKEASGSLEQCMNIVRHKPDDFLLISGDDLLTLPLYSIGARGVISVLANAFPSLFKKVQQYVSSGQYEKAQKEHFKLLEINGSMYEEGSPVGIKQLLSEMELCSNVVRLPHMSASEALQKKITVAYRHLKK